MNKIIPGLLALALAGFLAAGCASAIYVSAGDPVLRICQSASVQANTDLQTTVDDAGGGYSMTSDQAAALRHAAADYRVLAGETSHRAFAAALRNEAQEFMVATSDNGLTTNSVAIAVDKFAGQIQGDCGSFTVGTAPQAGKPGPGFNWGPVWFWAGIYVMMTLFGGWLIAFAQRSKPRGKRLKPAEIFWLSLVWWVTIFGAIGQAYSHTIASMTLTRDEKKDDRLAALAKENARLEVQLRKPLP